jgi:hypothetical protein
LSSERVRKAAYRLAAQVLAAQVLANQVIDDHALNVSQAVRDEYFKIANALEQAGDVAELVDTQLQLKAGAA